jgi:hypothetical protein
VNCRLLLASVLSIVGTLLAVAPSASACAPTAALGFGGIPAGTPTPPTFRPGDDVTVIGTGFGTERSANVVLRWGVDGPLAGETAIGADGSWQLTFAIPTAMPAGMHVLFADDGDVNGFMVTLALRVDAAAPAQAPPAAEPVASDDSLPVVATPSSTESRPPAAAKDDRGATAHGPRLAPKSRQPARKLRPAVARPTRPRAAPPSHPAALGRHHSEAPRHRPAPPQPAPAAKVRPRAVPGPIALPGRPRSPFPWLLVMIGIPSALVAAVAVVLLVRARRRAARDAEIEAELQELLAEEQARRLQRRTRG